MQGVGAEMDINVLRGAILITLTVSFVGLWAWAWSRKRKPAFHEASLLPLEEDGGQVPGCEDPTDKTRSNGKGSESC